MAVLAGRGRPDHCFRKQVVTASSCCTKVSDRSREEKGQASLLMTKCSYSHGLEVEGRSKSLIVPAVAKVVLQCLSDSRTLNA